ncbi:MAG TPA: tripartite tricarboxylate transporter TctB family protein [Gammaproteobacteria bacterium]
MQTLLSRRNVLVGSILLIVGIAYGFLTAALPNRTLPNTPGPAFFPWIITTGLVSLSIALVLQSIRAGAQEEIASAKINSSRALALVIFVAYIAMLPYAGFLMSSVPFFAGMMWLYGERRALVLIVGAVIVPVGLYYLFRAGFSILLPVGVW